MRKTFLYILGGQLASISIPVAAQEASADPIPEAVKGGALTPEQMAAFDSWPAERQAEYEAWPTDAQAYFWSLSSERQEIFWMLRDEDKLALVAMDDPSREQAWTVIEQRVGTATRPSQPETTEPETTEPETTEPGDPPMR